VFQLATTGPDVVVAIKLTSSTYDPVVTVQLAVLYAAVIVGAARFKTANLYIVENPSEDPVQ
jgi:hypothetical protein